MKIFDDNGVEVNAEISIVSNSLEHQIIIESSGGGTKAGRPRRNPDYNKAVFLILSRIRKSGMDINGIYLASRKTKKMGLSLQDRLVQINKWKYPIFASSIEPDILRKAIGRTVAKMEQSPGVKSTGNAQKRILIEVMRYKDNSLSFSDIIKGTTHISFDDSDFEDFEPDFTQKQDVDQREKQRIAIAVRRGQPKFRKKLIKAYKGKCAVTNSMSLYVLEAAHISSYNGPQTNHAKNGLLLRSDIHTLFDLGLLSITNEYMIIISEDLKGSDYWKYNNKKIKLPDKESLYPSKKALKTRWNDRKI